LDIPLIVDEAYGEFMEIANSASSLLEKYRNLIVVKSFSKGFGLAGLRAGYAMMDRAAADVFSRACFEMSLNEFAYRTVAMALDDTQHVRDSLVKIAENKGELLASLTKLIPAHTDLTTPIMLLETKKDVDLYEIFMKHHVITESGADFAAIDKRFVRVRISGDDRLKAKIREIETEEDI
ncbi:MAG: aminotransferase class I/II-fold pyridoxal phosphate-dependent enzyme, partial [Eubacteriaceae bacterium]|nr:aminotransferase class I/II-fold pyridoxal phosphate-dependent enzyme [Eubacteriaceae bacterium]